MYLDRRIPTFNVSNDWYNQEWLFKIDESGLVK